MWTPEKSGSKKAKIIEAGTLHGLQNSKAIQVEQVEMKTDWKIARCSCENGVQKPICTSLRNIAIKILWKHFRRLQEDKFAKGIKEKESG